MQLDEASNHLDLECSEALSEALGGWGDDRGALVVVSHDQRFCERIPFTHVATVQDGKMVLQERGLRDRDWSSTSLSIQLSDKAESDANQSATDSSSHGQDMDPAIRKKLYNAPKRIEKLESLIADAEAKIAMIDEEMMVVGSDVGKLVDLNSEKEKLATTVEAYMNEWEELEELVAQAT